MRGRGGNDTLDGGAGQGDVADYRSALTGVNITLANAGLDTINVNDGQGGLDTLCNIEGLRGSDFSDFLGGNNIANILMASMVTTH